MFSDAAVHMLRAAKANPAASALCCTAFGVYTVRMHYMKKTLARLEENNRELQAALKEKKDAISQRLTQLEDVVKKDLTNRDAFIRRMELQNVEQTRSVDRLQHTLRSCSTSSVVSSASSNAQNVMSAHQQTQTQTQTTAVDSKKDSVPHLPHQANAVPEPTAAATITVEIPATTTAVVDVVVPNIAEEIVVVQPIDRVEQLRSRVVQETPIYSNNTVSVSSGDIANAPPAVEIASQTQVTDVPTPIEVAPFVEAVAAAASPAAGVVSASSEEK